MTNAYLEAIAYNNVGVALLEMGNFQEARELFVLAIESMKGVLDCRLVAQASSCANSNSSNGGNNGTLHTNTLQQQQAAVEANVSCSLSASAASSSASRTAVAQQQQLLQQQQQLHDDRQKDASPPVAVTATAAQPAAFASAAASGSIGRTGDHDPGGPFSGRQLYDFLRPIYISEDDFRLYNASLVKLTISLLFNLAMSDHAIATSASACATNRTSTAATSSSSSSSLLETTIITTAANAIFLYQLAYCLQVKDGIELSRIHTMGMINNVGRLLAFLGDVKESENCFRHLLKKLMTQVVEDSTLSRTMETIHAATAAAGTTTTTMPVMAMDTSTTNAAAAASTSQGPSYYNHHNNNNNNNRAATQRSRNDPNMKSNKGEEMEQIEGFLDNIVTVILRHTLSSPAA